MVWRRHKSVLQWLHDQFSVDKSKDSLNDISNSTSRGFLFIDSSMINIYAWVEQTKPDLMVIVKIWLQVDE